MFIDSDAREWAAWDIDPEPTGDLEVTFDGATWYPTERDGVTVRVLVAGEDATDNPAGTVVLSRGRHPAVLRLVSDPEVIVRYAGAIQAG